MREYALEQVAVHHRYAEASIANRISAIRFARDVGVSWEAIGEAMGMSRQTAHKRFAEHVGETNHQVRRRAERLERLADRDDTPD